MRAVRNSGVFVVSLVLLSLEAMAGVVTRDFSAIVRKNVFRLSPPRPEEKPIVVQPELPQIRLQGVANLGLRQALLQIQTKTKAVTTVVSCILVEGQTRDGVKVLKIDMESGTVWLTNQGVEQVLTAGR